MSTKRGAASRRVSQPTLAGFAWRYGALTIAFLAVVKLDAVAFDEIGVGSINRLATNAVATVLSWLGTEVTVRDTIITDALRPFAFRIISECTGIDLLGLLLAAVVACRCAWRQRAAMAGVVVVVMVALNLLRMTSLYYVGRDFEWAYEIAHVYVWPVVLTGLSLGAWYAWLKTQRVAWPAS